MEDLWKEPEGLTESDAGSVADRLTELGLNPIDGMSFLPSNFWSAKTQGDLFFAPRMPDLKVLFRQANVTVSKIEPDGVKLPYRDDRDSTLVLPLVFISASLLSNQPHLVTVALGVLSTYVADFFRGVTGTKRVRCGIVVERTDKTTTVDAHYDGPPEQFEKLTKAIERMMK